VSILSNRSFSALSSICTYCDKSPRRLCVEGKWHVAKTAYIVLYPPSPIDLPVHIIAANVARQRTWKAWRLWTWTCWCRPLLRRFTSVATRNFHKADARPQQQPSKAPTSILWRLFATSSHNYEGKLVSNPAQASVESSTSPPEWKALFHLCCFTKKW
jgi:hypothetical protein